MKLKILGVFFIVLVAQAHVAQGALTFGTVTTGVTNLVTGAVSAGGNILNTTVGVITDKTAVVINGTVNGILTVANKTTSVVSTVLNVTTNIVSTGQTLLTNTVNSINNVIANLSSEVQNSNISSGLSDATNSAINTVLTNIRDDVNGLTTVTEKTANKVLNVVTAIPDIFFNLVQNIKNAANVNIPEFDLLNDIQEILNTTGSPITNKIINAIESGVGDLSSVVIPLGEAGLEAFTDILTIIDGAPEILNNITATLEETVAATITAIANDINNFISLLTGIATTCGNNLASAGKTLINTTTTNAISCVTTEIVTINDYATQYKNLATKLKAEIANEVVSASTVESIITLTATIAVNAELSMYKLPLCEGIQAIKTLSNIPALILTVFSCAG